MKPSTRATSEPIKRLASPNFLLSIIFFRFRYIIIHIGRMCKIVQDVPSVEISKRERKRRRKKKKMPEKLITLRVRDIRRVKSVACQESREIGATQ